MDLDAILDRLERHHQRATYGAIAGLVGGIPRSLMQHQARTRRNSFAVNRQTRMPTGYPPGDHHENLTANSHVIRTTDELRLWLASHA